MNIPKQGKLLTRWIPILALMIGLFISPILGRDPVFSQSPWLEIRVASGYPEELPADGESTTVFEVSIDRCDFGVPIDSSGTFSVSSRTNYGTISFLGGDLPEQPVQLLLQSSTDIIVTLIDVEISYCPADGIVLMGVCSDPASVNAVCSGSTAFTFYDPEDKSHSSGQTNNPDPAPPATENQEQATSEKATSEQIMSENEASSEILMTELYNDLEEYLAGEGITAPTPRQIGTSGIAITTLLAGWIVLNQMAGTSVEKSFEVIKTWKDGERPPIGVEVELPADLEDGDVGIEGDLPEESPYPADEEQSAPLERTPVQESGEDRLLRGVKDAQDLDDTVKQTRKDFEAFQNKVPDQIKNSATWKKHIAPQIKKANDLINKGKLDKARTWLDRAKKLIELRKDVVRDLDHLPPDQQEAIVWSERGLKTLGHIASDAYQTAVVDPATAFGENILPPELAKKWKKAMEELGQGMSETAQGIGELPRKGARLATHGNLQDQADQMLQDSSLGIRQDGQMIKELHGPREVKVEYPDWGKSPRKVLKLYDKFKDWAFGDR